MTDKEQIERLKNEIAELRETNDYYKRECNGYWAELLERKKINLAIAQKIVKTDGKAIANIILNMHFGKIPSDSCSFCEIFNLRGKAVVKMICVVRIALMTSCDNIIQVQAENFVNT